MVCFVVPVDRLRLCRLKLDLCDKTMVDSVSFMSYCFQLSVDFLSSVKLSHIFFITQDIF